MLFGYELEFFVVNRKGKVVVPPDELHYFKDGGGVLVEARGEPMSHPKLAETSLKLALERLKKAVRKEKLTLLLTNESEIDPCSLRKAHCKKSLMCRRVVEERFRNPVVLEHFDPDHYLAGFHVHFSQKEFDKYVPFDMVYPIRLLDEAFGKEIIKSGRYPGAYRMKPPYGFEYRSLPAKINIPSVTKVLLAMLEARPLEVMQEDDEDDE